MANFLKKIELATKGKQSLTNIDQLIRQTIKESKIQDGFILLFCPHTTAAITINENADPDVQKDLNFAYNETFPNRSEFVHMENNSDGHLKSSLTGASEMIILSEGKLLLGMWQSIYFWDFDGPRVRNVIIKIIGDC